MVRTLPLVACATYLVATVLTTPVEAKALMVAPNVKPSAMVAVAEMAIVGKVVEIEKDPIELLPYAGAPADAKVTMKVAVIRIGQTLLGGEGLTQIRVAFLESAAAPAVPQLPGGGLRPIRRPLQQTPNLTVDLEGCFLLQPHPVGDVKVLVGPAAVLDKKTPTYEAELTQIKQLAAAIDNPVKALKAEKAEDRAVALSAILQRYGTVRVVGGKPVKTEPVPAEENALILQVLAELPWAPEKNDYNKPNRGNLWFLIRPERYGFVTPKYEPKPGDAPDAYNKLLDEASGKFLKEKGTKIQILRPTQ
jgi:hypothetical protein